ncbi:anaphase-promoting complex subunit 2, partial [Datura stramonium]|nr:anaphase-promoting complex subunit 2 [Datura stramonium]
TVIPEGISKHVHAAKYLIVGGVAGATSCTATTPLDRLKVVLQVQTTRASIGSVVRVIWKEGGVLSFLRGNALNVLKGSPECAIKEELVKIQNNQKQTPPTGLQHHRLEV